MGLIKKSMKGALAVSTLGGSVMAQKAITAAGTGASALTEQEQADGALLAVMSH